jgi:hypothetical protein
MLAWVQGEEAHLASPCRKTEERGERGILRYIIEGFLAKENYFRLCLWRLRLFGMIALCCWVFDDD